MIYVLILNFPCLSLRANKKIRFFFNEKMTKTINAHFDVYKLRSGRNFDSQITLTATLKHILNNASVSHCINSLLTAINFIQTDNNL